MPNVRAYGGVLWLCPGFGPIEPAGVVDRHRAVLQVRRADGKRDQRGNRRRQQRRAEPQQGVGKQPGGVVAASLRLRVAGRAALPVFFRGWAALALPVFVRGKLRNMTPAIRVSMTTATAGRFQGTRVRRALPQAHVPTRLMSVTSGRTTLGSAAARSSAPREEDQIGEVAEEDRRGSDDRPPDSRRPRKGQPSDGQRDDQPEAVDSGETGADVQGRWAIAPARRPRRCETARRRRAKPRESSCRPCERRPGQRPPSPPRAPPGSMGENAAAPGPPAPWLRRKRRARRRWTP